MDGTPLTDSSMPPVAYDNLNQVFSIFSEDYDFDGLKTLTVSAFMTEYDMHTYEIEIDLQIFNPCSEIEHVQITGVAPEQQRYVLYTSSQESPQTFTHDEFTVTSDFDNTLCGEFTYEATFDDSSISDSTLPPISYDPSSR